MIMEWPWVTRKYLNLNKDFDRQIITNLHRELAGLEKEINYWRERYEAEKERADKAVDSLVLMCGREPISDASNKTHESVQRAAKEMNEQMGEIYGDVAKSILEPVEGDEIVDESPQESPVVEIAERLRRLQLIPFYNKPKSAEKSASDTSSPSASVSDTIVQ